MRLKPLLCVVAIAALITIAESRDPGPGTRLARPPDSPETLYVHPERGDDQNPGTESRPLKSVTAAVLRLPDPLWRGVTIRLAPGVYAITGDDASPGSLLLMNRMRSGVVVSIVGAPGTLLAWEGGAAMVVATDGRWRLENLQVGTGSKRQRRGVHVTGPAEVELKDVTFRTRSQSDAGIHAQRGGKVSLYGTIRLNEHLHEQGGEETFCGIVAEDRGLVKFEQRQGASLEMGNGSLSASYYGCIRLGCETARITCWGDQSNNLAINNGGRIDLHGTRVTLRARQKRNTPIGLEHDGHILGEGARVCIEGENDTAIALQKASTFTCNDIELRGRFERCVWAASGSMFVGRFLTDVGRVEATTGAGIHVEAVRGRFDGPAVATHGAVISLPDRDVWASGR